MSSRYINVFIYQSAEGNKSTKNKKRSFESCTAQYNVDVIFMTNTQNNARAHTHTHRERVRERTTQSSSATEKNICPSGGAMGNGMGEVEKK